MSFKWRKWLLILHRDIGYLSVGLIIIYAISGIAVNHINDWNPNYIITKDTVYITPLKVPISDVNITVETILQKINEDAEIKSTFFPDSNSIHIFAEGNTIKVDLPSGRVEQEKVRNRSVFKETNFLHLNNPKKVWTYVADLFAVGLSFLAISGLFMLRGKNGLAGRGKWLVGIGILIPIIFLLIYY